MKDSAITTLFQDQNMMQLFKTLEKNLLTFDGVEERVTKTQVAFKRKRQFAWLWPVPPGKNRLMLTLDMLHEVKHPIFENVDHPRADKWTYQIYIHDESLVETVLSESWLYEAYLFGSN